MRNTLSYRNEYNGHGRGPEYNLNYTDLAREKSRKAKQNGKLALLVVILLMFLGAGSTIWFWYWVFKNVFAYVKKM